MDVEHPLSAPQMDIIANPGHVGTDPTTVSQGELARHPTCLASEFVLPEPDGTWLGYGAPAHWGSTPYNAMAFWALAPLASG